MRGAGKQFPRFLPVSLWEKPKAGAGGRRQEELGAGIAAQCGASEPPGMGWG